MTPKDQIIGLLPSLTPAERKQVASAIALLGGLESPLGPSVTDDWILAGIISYLVRRGLLAEQGALFGLKRRDAYKTYMQKMPAIVAFFARIETQSGLYKRHRPMLALLAARALGDLLIERGIFSVGAMLTQIDRIPEAMDRAFPDYIACGMLGMVLKQSHEEKV